LQTNPAQATEAKAHAPAALLLPAAPTAIAYTPAASADDYINLDDPELVSALYA